VDNITNVPFSLASSSQESTAKAARNKLYHVEIITHVLFYPMSFCRTREQAPKAEKKTVQCFPCWGLGENLPRDGLPRRGAWHRPTGLRKMRRQSLRGPRQGPAPPRRRPGQDRQKTQSRAAQEQLELQSRGRPNQGSGAAKGYKRYWRRLAWPPGGPARR